MSNYELVKTYIAVISSLQLWVNPNEFLSMTPGSITEHYMSLTRSRPLWVKPLLNYSLLTFSLFCVVLLNGSSPCPWGVVGTSRPLWGVVGTSRPLSLNRRATARTRTYLL